MELKDLKERYAFIEMTDARVSGLTLEDGWLNRLTVAHAGDKKDRGGFLKIYQGDESWDQGRDPYYIERNKEAIDDFIALLKESLYRIL